MKYTMKMSKVSQDPCYTCWENYVDHFNYVIASDTENDALQICTLLITRASELYDCISLRRRN